MARILYLDDEETIIFLVTRMLEFLKHRATGYSSAAAALTAFQGEPTAFDLVLTDLAMPGMSGLEFAQRILAIRPGMPVAIASGHVDPRDIETARALGILAVVAKPHTLEEMARTVDDLLHQAHAVTTADR
jgi:two-component system cell cycle sensor histidine kinase/response regulator CckA